MQQQQIPRKVKLAGLVTLVLIVVIGVGYGIFTQISRSGKIAVTVLTTPRDAEILVGDKKIGTGTVYLVPDRVYDIKVHKDGFEDVTRSQYISSDENSILANLTPVSEEAIKWAEENQSQYQAVEAQGSVAANKEGAAFLDEHPIIEVLPYENLIYTIGYRADPSDKTGNSIILSIDTTEGYRNAAVQQIRDLGYDPTKFKIEFNDYKNPFAS